MDQNFFQDGGVSTDIGNNMRNVVKMAKQNNSFIGTFIIIALIAGALYYSGVLNSFIGEASGTRYVYVNTYLASNLTQIPASVSYSYSANHGLGTTSGSCQTSITQFNPQVFVTELDGMYKGSTYITNAYAYPSQQNKNIAICQIILPAQQYNTTMGTLTISASTGGYASDSQQMELTIQSTYSQGSGGYNPLMITIPLGSTQSSTTTIASTTISSTSTTSVESTTTAPTNAATNAATTSQVGSTTTIQQQNNNTNATCSLTNLGVCWNGFLKWLGEIFRV
jgi:hypothetical protein